MDGYLSEVRMFAGNFAPVGWAFCDGSIQSVAANGALFSLLGTSFGGDGISTFALPDLRSRVAVHNGQGSGLSAYTLGQTAGAEGVTLIPANVSNHTHTVSGNAGIAVVNGDGQTANPVNNFLSGNGDAIYSTATDNVAMAPASLTGVTVAAQTPSGTTAIDTRQPYIAINFIICTQGPYPSRP